MMMLTASAVWLLLAEVPGTSISNCAGNEVVGGYGANLPLLNHDGAVALSLKLEKGKLSQPLNVLACNSAAYLVSYEGDKYAVERTRARIGQVANSGPCPPNLGGKTELTTNASNMGIVDGHKCSSSKADAVPVKASK